LKDLILTICQKTIFSIELLLQLCQSSDDYVSGISISEISNPFVLLIPCCFAYCSSKEFLELGSVSLLTLFFRAMLAILGLLLFHLNFRISLVIFTTEIVFKLQIKLGSWTSWQYRLFGLMNVNTCTFIQAFDLFHWFYSFLKIDLVCILFDVYLNILFF
jgi:hypothetical protein